MSNAGAVCSVCSSRVPEAYYSANDGNKNPSDQNVVENQPEDQAVVESE